MTTVARNSSDKYFSFHFYCSGEESAITDCATSGINTMRLGCPFSDTTVAVGIMCATRLAMLAALLFMLTDTYCRPVVNNYLSVTLPGIFWLKLVTIQIYVYSSDPEQNALTAAPIVPIIIGVSVSSVVVVILSVSVLVTVIICCCILRKQTSE